MTIMKKTYIIPQMQLTVVDCESLIAESLIIGDGTATGEDGGWVKEERGTGWGSSGKSVWDDDWSKTE